MHMCLVRLFVSLCARPLSSVVTIQPGHPHRPPPGSLGSPPPCLYISVGVLAGRYYAGRLPLIRARGALYIDWWHPPTAAHRPASTFFLYYVCASFFRASRSALLYEIHIDRVRVVCEMQIVAERVNWLRSLCAVMYLSTFFIALVFLDSQTFGYVF